MTTKSLLLSGGALMILASTLVSAQPPSTGTVHVRFNVAQPAGLTGRMPIAAQVYRVERDNFGRYKNTGLTQTIVDVLDPATRDKQPVQLETDLQLGVDVEYEFKFVVLDADGHQRTDGAYLFVRPTVAGELLDETLPLRPGELNELHLNMRWVDAGDYAKSNFLKVDQEAGRSEYVLALYVIDSTNISLLK